MKEITKASYDLQKFEGVIEKNQTKLVLDQRIVVIESLSLLE